jgi:hypothetical protein
VYDIVTAGIRFVFDGVTSLRAVGVDLDVADPLPMLWDVPSREEGRS